MVLYYSMYKPVQLGIKCLFVAATLFAVISINIYGRGAYAADFKSEEELIEETRAAVEKHLNSDEDNPFYKENSGGKKEPALKSAPVIAKEKPVTALKKPVIRQNPAPIVAKKSAIVEEKKPQAKQPQAKQPEATDLPATTKKDETPPDVTKVGTDQDYETPSDKQAMGEDLEDVSGVEEMVEVKPLIEPILKKMDVDKIGASPYYETYEGLRLLKYFTIAQRVEIYQEARPIDSYILDAFAMRYANWPHVPWNIKSDYRTQLTPLFTRAYGTEITFSDPKNKEGQVRYTHDYREIYKNYYPKWPQIQKEMWDQNEILFIHSKQIEPVGWNYTSNVGYRYSTMSDKEDPADGNNSYYNIRQTYFASLSLAPNERFEWFGQGEYYKSRYAKCSWAYSPDHFLGRMELRIRSKDMKTMYVPSFSFSKDYYYPFTSTYQKYEIQFRVGRDFTKRFSASSTIRYVMGLRDESDHNDWLPGPVSKPFKDKAYALTMENRFSYNVYDKLYLQAGADISNGLNWSIFDNVAMLAGLEYYAPGMIRVDVGWRGNYYYNLQDVMSSIYFKFYLFM